MTENRAYAVEAAESGVSLISPQNGEVAEMRDLHFRFLELARVAPLSVEVGPALAALIRPGHADGLLEKVTALRRQIAFELGLVVPGIRFVESAALQPDQYSFKVHGVEAAVGRVEPEHLLAIPSGGSPLELEGRQTAEPIYGAPAVWIDVALQGRAEALGAGVYDVTSVLVIHLSEVVRAHAADLLGRQEVKYLLDFVATDHPDLVGVLTQALSLGEVRAVLQSLLRERVPIRDVVPIFEALCDIAPLSKMTLHLVEGVRMALSRGICKAYMDEAGVVSAITLDEAIERRLLEVVGRITDPSTASSPTAIIDNTLAEHLLEQVGPAFERSRESGAHAVLVTHPGVRLFLRRLLEPVYPHVPVLSWTEVMNGRPPRPRIKVLATLHVP